MVRGEAAAGYDPASRSLAIAQLNELQRLAERKRTDDPATQAHVAHLKLLIARALTELG